MAYIIAKQKWRQAPQYPVEIRHDGIAKGLIGFPFIAGANLSLVPNLVQGRGQFIGEGSPTVVRVAGTQLGQVIRFHPAGGANGYTKAQLPNQALNPSSDFTGIWIGYTRATAGGLQTCVLSRGGNGTGGDSIRASWTTTTNFRFSYIDSSPAQFNLDLTTPTYVQDTLYRVCVVRRGGVRYSRVWDGATFSQSASQSTGLVSMRDDSKGVGFGGTTISLHGDLVAGLWWNRGLSDAEIWEAFQNPYQVLKPLTRRIYVNAAAGGGGTADGALSASGDSSASFTGSELAAAVLSASGDSTASFGGAEIAQAALSASADSSASFSGAALASGVLSSAGDSTASFGGHANAAGVWAAAADSSASFAGTSVSGGQGVFGAAGDSSGIFVGAELARAVLAAAADSSAAYVGAADVAGVLSADGVATAAFVEGSAPPEPIYGFGARGSLGRTSASAGKSGIGRTTAKSSNKGIGRTKA